MYFGFFKLARACESVLRFYSYDGATNYLKLKTVGLQGDCPEFMIFCMVTLHLWVILFSTGQSMFKEDGNLDFKMGKTKFLAKGTISAGHLYERDQHFLRTIPVIQHMDKEFTPEYTSANITLPPQEHFVSAQHRHVDTAIVNATLKKGTRNSFVHWHNQDYDMAVTMLQMSHTMGGFGLTPNVLAQYTTKVAMGSRFLGFVGSLPPDEQKNWIPNQSTHDPQTWVTPNLLHLKSVYEVLLNKHNCKEQESYLGQDQPLHPSDTLL